MGLQPPSGLEPLGGEVPSEVPVVGAVSMLCLNKLVHLSQSFPLFRGIALSLRSLEVRASLPAAQCQWLDDEGPAVQKGQPLVLRWDRSDIDYTLFSHMPDEVSFLSSAELDKHYPVLCSSRPVILKWGSGGKNLPLRGHWQCLETFLVVTAGGRGDITGI